MTTNEFLRDLLQQDVRVWLEGDRVRCSAPPGVLTTELRSELVRRRPEIQTVLQAARSAVSPTSIVPIETRGSRVPFYGVPGHNGDVFCFVRLARALGADQPFFGLQPPGLDVHGGPLNRIEDLAEHYVLDMLQHQPRGPYQIGGYCLGGLTAFEMARKLRARGHDVAAVVLFGTSAPTSFHPINRARGAVELWIAERRRGAHAFAQLTGRERLRHLQHKAAHLLAPLHTEGSHDEFAMRRQRVEQATIAAARAYRAGVYEGRLTLFIPNDAAARSADRPLDWRRYAAGTEVCVGPDSCDGDSMLKEPSVAFFAERLAGYLGGTSAAAATA